MLEDFDVEIVDISLDVCKKEPCTPNVHRFFNSCTRRGRGRRDPLWTLWILLYHVENPIAERY